MLTLRQRGLFLVVGPPALIRESLLTCPLCGVASLELMPLDACRYFFECGGCHTLLRPETRRLLRILLHSAR